MIVKLTKRGCICRYIEADDVLEQPVSGGIDVEITKGGRTVFRALIGMPELGHKDAEWERAYLMENGKTIDTIRAQVETPPISEKEKRERFLEKLFSSHD